MRAYVVKRNAAKLTAKRIGVGAVRFFSIGELANLAKEFDIIISENRGTISIEFNNKGIR